MPPMDDFHDAVKRVKPAQPVNAETYWIGVLPTEMLPKDVTQHTDLVWIKAKGKIVIGKIKSAFCKAQNLKSTEVLMKFKNTLLEDYQRIRDLDVYRDKLVAIEAVNQSDRLTRFPTEHQPLQDLTNEPTSADPGSLHMESYPTLSNSTVGPGSLHMKSDLPLSNSTGRHGLLKPFDVLPQMNNLNSSGSRNQARTPAGAMTNANPPLYHPDMEDSTLMAFTDFACEQRELRRRLSPSQPFEQFESQIRSDWQDRCQDERSMNYYRTRSSAILSTAIRSPGLPPASWLVSNFIGFWTFYYAIYREDRRRNLPTDTFQKELFDRVLKDWNILPYNARRLYMTPHMDELEKYPITLPDTNPVKTETKITLDPKEVEVKADDSALSTEETNDPVLSEMPPAFNIQDLFTGCTTDQLARGVGKGMELLDKIRNILSSQGQTSDTAQWLENIQNVAKQAQPSKTIVGVVGNTGAGKSSVINALLDEERLVPTNCMRACTAVVTEISYNEEDIPYRAEIEFISTDSWRDELKVLFQDLLDGNGGISSEVYNEDSEAGVAYAKIRAVYPKLTREEMSKSSIDELMAYENISQLLGNSKQLSDSDSLRFYRNLQKYVDSKEKSTGSKGKDRAKEKNTRDMEFWPLIRVVRLYVKAEALRSGVVLCDLPGVHDSNQARAAVAENYLKQCTGLWIVAPITRAVDDKAAKSLLGESFKRQLKMDGGFNTVTFICSKTDDISIVEAQDSLGIEDEMSELWREADALDKAKKTLREELEGLKEAKSDYSAALESAEEELDVWDKLLDDISDGLTVYAPTPKSGDKRKHRSGSESPRKRHKHSQEDSDGDFIDDNESDDGNKAIETDGEDRGDPLTKDQIQSKITEIKTMKKDGRREKAKLDESIQKIRSKLSDMDADKAKVDAEMSAICISGRNQYSKSAIQQDFAAGIKELDQELAEEQDAANFNPEVDARDYEEVARGLPVFCVSSRAYQKLQGRMKQDARVPGFKHIDETEIPQLQAHCQKLTEAGRESACRRFLNSLNQLLNSLRLWSSDGGTGRNLSASQRAREVQILEGFFKRLDADIEKAVKSVCNTVGEELQDQVYDHFTSAIEKAIEAALPTVDHWGAPVNRVDRAAGGLHWGTYKAICRRGGVYTNAQGLHDFNAQLTDPMLRVFAPGWERCFSRRLPGIMATLSTHAGQALEKFHSSVEDRVRRSGGSIASLLMLKNQLATYKETFKDIATFARDEIMAKQKDINREFVPVVAGAMDNAYNGCSAEYGPGSFMRMKALMSAHVGNQKEVMFHQSTEAVKLRLKKMVSGVEDNMLEKADMVFLAVKRDYTAAVVGQTAVNFSDMPRGERLLRREILDTVDSAELAFKRSLGMSVEEETSGDAMEDNDDQSTVTKSSGQCTSPKAATDGDTEPGTEETKFSAFPGRLDDQKHHNGEESGAFKIHEDMTSSSASLVSACDEQIADVDGPKVGGNNRLSEINPNFGSSGHPGADRTGKESNDVDLGRLDGNNPPKAHKEDGHNPTAEIC